jgi:hypothetical protein
VDDDATFRRLARLLLAAHGLVIVAEADSAAEAARRPCGLGPTARWWTSSFPTATVSRLPAS